MIVITPANKFGIYKQVVVTASGLTCDGAFLPFSVIGTVYEISEDDSLMPSKTNSQPLIVPSSVSMRQARLALLKVGKLVAVNAAIANMAGVEGDAARIEWEFSNEVLRHQPLVDALSPVLNMTSVQIDQLFITAAGL